jgi:hypothetical protein
MQILNDSILASPLDRAVVTDPAIHYRSHKIDGRYHLTATTPVTGKQTRHRGMITA